MNLKSLFLIVLCLFLYMFAYYSGFGSAQAKEMLDHLESVLANEPVSVKSGKFIVEVKPQVRS
jgi:hypothetical protein